MLEARLLGRFDVRLDSVTVDIPSRPAQSLFAYLLLNAGTAHRRERLAGLLWPESADESARSNLRHALWRIRRSLEAAGAADCLIADDLSVSFDERSPHWIDVAVLQAESNGDETAAHLRERVSAYRGELLPGFYDEWVILERERLRGTFDRTMQRLLDLLVREERWADVAECGEQWLSAANSPEPAYRALMIAAAGRGDVASVAAAYRRCVTALRADLGVDPSDQTQALYERLSKGGSRARVGDGPAPAAMPVGAMPTADPEPGDPPFKGLRHFDAIDAERFFGREVLVARLRDRLRKSRFLAVIGASGSGKSSLVRAGLVPSLVGSAAPDRASRVVMLTPTAHPLESLNAALSGVAVGTSIGPTDDVLIAVDQFEEVFTECADEAERRAFIEKLVAATDADGTGSVVLTLRADYYAPCARYASLRDLLAAHQEYIGPMTTAELRRAIEEPARRGGWDFEPGLVDLLLRDVGDEPGALPLLSHALLETWQRRRGRSMTLRSYAESGGVQGAIAKTAETVYNQRLTADERELARGIFLRLAAFGDDAQSTRRRVAIAELATSDDARPAVDRLLRILADARLVTVGAGAVEVAHEALIREWPTLRQWLSDDREGLRIHRRLGVAAQEWDASGREASELYRGARLGQAVDWASTHSARMNAAEREYLRASTDAADRETMEREARQREELAAARRAATVQRRNTYMLGGAFVVALVLAVTALFFGEQARSSALATQAVARTAASRELAAAALSQLDVDPERSVLLALQAVSTTYPTDGRWTAEAEYALHRAVNADHLRARLVGHTDVVLGIAFSPDGKRVATAGSDAARVWDATNGKALLTLTHSETINAAVFSPDGTLIATASDDGSAKIWDASTGKELRTLSGGNTKFVTSVAFSPDGRSVTTASYDLTTRVWDVASGRQLTTLQGHTSGVRMVAYAPDGTRVVTGSLDQTARVWDLSTGKDVLTLRHGANVFGVAWSPDGARIVTAGGDSTARLWDAASGRELLSFGGYRSGVQGVAFTPDSKRVLIGSYSGELKVWDTTSGRMLLALNGHPNSIYGVAISPDGRRAGSVGLDKIARIWSLGPDTEVLTIAAQQGSLFAVAFDRDATRFASSGTDMSAAVWDARTGERLVRLVGHRDQIYRLAWSPDGARLATASRDGTAKIWDAQSGREIVALVGHGPRLDPGDSFAGIIGVAFSPDGARVVTGGTDGTGRIWDAATGRELRVLRGHTMRINGVGFSPDGSRIVTTSDDMTARVWDAATGQELRILKGHVERVWGAAFSPDGRRLATASTDGTARVWDVATGQQVIAIRAHVGTISAITYSTDGSRLATAGADGYGRMWDSADGTPVLTVGDGLLQFRFVALSPDSRQLAVAAGDGTVRVYFTRIDELIALARSRVTRGLTPDECRVFLHRDSCP